MAKIKLTKTELKVQRDALKRFSRYLPTLQLKKQQLQLETRRVRDELDRLEAEEAAYLARVHHWAGLLTPVLMEREARLAKVSAWETAERNIAGVSTPVFGHLTFTVKEFDGFVEPLLLDDLIEAVRTATEFRLKHHLLNEQLNALEDELRVTTQRVNLFEKVKIPEAKENIRRIQIYLGDEQTNAVGRAKIAKAKTRMVSGEETAAAPALTP